MFLSAPQSSSPDFPAFLLDVFWLTAQVHGRLRTKNTAKDPKNRVAI
jgi:hypothetical protein